MHLDTMTTAPLRQLRKLAIFGMALATVGGLATRPAHAQTPAPAFYVSEFELTDPEGIKPYSAQVESTFTPFGGRYVVRGGKVNALEGMPTKRFVMIAFPSFEQAQGWYDSPAYRAIMPIRHRSASSRAYIVEGLRVP
jgi:uncharacterized protein (DUF1330 family)